jgi:hypothetical protein
MVNPARHSDRLHTVTGRHQHHTHPITNHSQSTATIKIKITSPIKCTNPTQPNPPTPQPHKQQKQPEQGSVYKTPKLAACNCTDCSCDKIVCCKSITNLYSHHQRLAIIVNPKTMSSLFGMLAIRRPRLMPLITAALILALMRLVRNRRRRRLLAESQLPMPRLRSDVPVHQAIEHQIVQTASGRVKGFRAQGRGVVSFRGVPYAAPPTGALRFKAPVDHEGWGEEVLDCTRFGPCAPQVMM